MATFIIDEIFLYLVARQKSLWVTQLFFFFTEKSHQAKKKLSIIFGEKKHYPPPHPPKKHAGGTLYIRKVRLSLKWGRLKNDELMQKKAKNKGDVRFMMSLHEMQYSVSNVNIPFKFLQILI